MNKRIQAINRPVHAMVTIPGSKSITNRAFLLAALADGVSEINDVLVSDDTLAFVEALHALGIAIQLDKENHTCLIAGAGGSFPNQEATIACGEAGTVARFLLAACANSRGIYHFDGAEALRKRPFAGLLSILSQQGATLIPENATTLPLTLLGVQALAGGHIEVDSSQTGQFLSALLMIAPFAHSPFILQTQQLVSQPYIEMTCAMMADFGVMVHRLHQEKFTVPVPQRYQARNYRVEPDLSTASYFFAAAAVTGGELTIQAFDRKKSKQGDRLFLEVLEKMGCIVTDSEAGLTVRGPRQGLQGINIDMRDFSDTFMTLAAIAPFAETPTTITNIRHTRHKESDRISAMHSGLLQLKIQVAEGPDWLRIYPSHPVAGKIKSHYDHRIAMAFAIIGLRVPGIEIENAECVTKTCPEFFTLWDALYA